MSRLLKILIVKTWPRKTTTSGKHMCSCKHGTSTGKLLKEKSRQSQSENLVALK